MIRLPFLFLMSLPLFLFANETGIRRYYRQPAMIHDTSGLAEVEALFVINLGGVFKFGINLI